MQKIKCWCNFVHKRRFSFHNMKSKSILTNQLNNSNFVTATKYALSNCQTPTPSTKFQFSVIGSHHFSHAIRYIYIYVLWLVHTNAIRYVAIGVFWLVPDLFRLSSSGRMRRDVSSSECPLTLMSDSTGSCATTRRVWLIVNRRSRSSR
jgi:hypothetical protein